MRNDVPIPERMKHLTVWNGYPIPYINVITDGVPDFRCNDMVKVHRCIEQKRCGICGGDFERGEWYFFIAGSDVLEDRLFLDPAMHKECAYYATKVCPFLAGTKRQHSTFTKTEKTVAGHYIKVEQERPKRLIIYGAKRYKVVEKGLVLLCQPAKSPSRIDWDAMPPSREEDEHS